jgi:Fis family transcriptional regulator, factor for inversion stimulation protein
MRETTRKNTTPAPVRRAASHLANDLPLRDHAERALSDYFASLNGHRPARLYDLVLREVEEPLFRTVLDYAAGNQSQAAIILGITRGTLRKKLREFGLSA